jgi:hypothetical protein
MDFIAVLLSNCFHTNTADPCFLFHAHPILDVVIDDEVEFPFGENVLFGPGSTQITIFHGHPLFFS